MLTVKREMLKENYNAFLGSRFLPLLESKTFCDVTLKVQNQTFQAHRVILAAASVFFEKMLTDGFIESHQEVIEFNSVPPNVFQQILNFIYQSEIHLDDDNIKDVFIAADMLQIDHLMDICCCYLETSYKPSNCLSYYELLDTYATSQKALNLKPTIKQFIEAHFYAVTLENEFKTISMAFLEKLLRSEGLCVSSEYWVLEALIRWVKCDVDSRIDCIDHLFPLIRFPVIPDEYKRKIINDCGDESIRTKLVQIQSNALLDDEQCTAIGRQQRMNCIPSIYILGGGDYSSAAKCHTVSVLDNGRRSWTEAKPMQFDGIGHEATEMNGLIYVAGGFSEQFGDRFRSFYSFDPIDNRWTHLSAMNHGRSSFLLVPFDGFLWAIGGNHSSLVERYDPKSDVWIDRLDYPSEFNRDSLFANSPVSGCIYKNRIILAAQDLVYSYYPKSGEWKRMPNMLRKRHLFKMCVLQDYVYAANCSTIERYSFAENKWQLVASPEKENRVVHINLLAEFQNQILMISSGTKFGRISIYRPETNSWICKETSKKIRYLAAATLCYSLFHG